MLTEVMRSELEDILHRHCPSCKMRKPEHGCPLCSHFRGALKEAKKEGYAVAIRLIEKHPETAASVLRTLINDAP